MLGSERGYGRPVVERPYGARSLLHLYYSTRAFRSAKDEMVVLLFLGWAMSAPFKL
jgi:hypothetical protein